MVSRAYAELSSAILAAMPRRPGVAWHVELERDGVILRCVVQAGQASARVTSPDEALAVTDSLITRADAEAVAVLLDEEVPDDEEPVLFAGVYWSYRDYLDEIVPYCEMPGNDDFDDGGYDDDEVREE